MDGKVERLRSGSGPVRVEFSPKVDLRKGADVGIEVPDRERLGQKQERHLKDGGVVQDSERYVSVHGRLQDPGSKRARTRVIYKHLNS